MCQSGTQVQQCVTALRAFVVAQGGSIEPSRLGEFYVKYPHVRAVVRPSAKVFIALHGRGLEWRVQTDPCKTLIVATGADSTWTVDSLCVAMRSFVIRRGGAVESGAIGDLYAEHPGFEHSLKAVCDSFVYFVAQYGAPYGLQMKSSTLKVRGDSAAPASKPAVATKTDPKPDVAAIRDVIQRLHANVKAHNGRFGAGNEFAKFLKTRATRRVMEQSGKKRLKKFVQSFGGIVPGIQVSWVIASNGEGYVVASDASAAPVAASEPSVTSVRVTPIQKCLELLDKFVANHNGVATSSLIGIFCKENPAVASVLRPNKAIASCKAFIDKYGQQNGYKLRWQAKPPAIVRGAVGAKSKPKAKATTTATATAQAKGQAKPPGVVHRAVDAPGRASEARLQATATAPASSYVARQSTVNLITTTAAATAIVRSTLRHANIIALDFEGDLSANGRMSLMQICVRSKGVFVFDLFTCPDILRSANVGLRQILMSASVTKVLHDGRHDARGLYGQFGIKLKRVFDTQVAFYRLDDSTRIVGLNTVLEKYTTYQNTRKNEIQHGLGLFDQRPLAPYVLDYAVQDVKYSIQAFDHMVAKMGAASLEECIEASMERIVSAVSSSVSRNQGHTYAGTTQAQNPNQGERSRTKQSERLSSTVRRQAPDYRDGKDGIEVEDKDPDAFLDTIVENATVTKRFIIKNNAATACVLHRAALVASTAALPFYLDSPPLPYVLPTGQQICIELRFCSQQSGTYRAVLTFQFSTEDSPVVDVVRIIDNVNCVSARTSKSIRSMIKEAASGKYVRNNQRAQPGYIVDRYTPLGYGNPFKIRVDKYDMPREFPTTVARLEVNYVDHFRHLLWMEERQLHYEQQDYDMIGAVLRQVGGTYRLAVPGLSENRPSVLPGDKVLLVHSGKTYQARAVDVTRDDVILGTPPSFAYRQGDRVEVRFVLSRMAMRLCHQGIACFSAAIHTKFLFPVVQSTATTIRREPLVPTAKLQSLNPEQVQAVHDVVNFSHFSAPYVIYGPPGTGKTVTLVEGLNQIARLNPSARILICASTNAAADLLCERLVQCLPQAQGRVLRVMAFMRKEKDTPAAVLPYTLRNGEGGFIPPSLQDLLDVSIIVTTLASGAKLYNVGLKRGHFDVIAVDEAGQTTEPDVMGVLGPFAGSTTALILAGDPRQLGAVIKSKQAATNGLDISLLERLVKMPLYDTSADSGQRVMTKLRRNYRAHPVLLAVPSKLFYLSSLLPHAPASVCRGLENWQVLPTAGVPLIFHGVQGNDCQERSSPSWFNPQEIALVEAYIDLLLTNTVGATRRIEPEDIGVITPYAQQRKKINQVLRASGYKDVRVGSVEQFQGAELPVIIVSTVRSSKDFFDEDAKFNLGFLGNPKRFNVAITRAQSLLIIVGNPFVLQEDPNWNEFLRHCRAHGAWRGAASRSAASNDTSARPDMIQTTKIQRESQQNSCVVM
ncbi:TPA: hypothetical protein N0F65_000705 [Lagenidium giganteum]|uniref:RNA helicase n=1 Tax=Lagenidium giganteum TaxID=4803 RepID=A0AAV2ZED2_9STRA|nr:TPA: hypothetical protein N0F65_000705 [Lagenidium giganteum]